jgi:hypothetical protein
MVPGLHHNGLLQQQERKVYKVLLDLRDLRDLLDLQD